MARRPRRPTTMTTKPLVVVLLMLSPALVGGLIRAAAGEPRQYYLAAEDVQWD